jgi:hypothetical protein
VSDPSKIATGGWQQGSVLPDALVEHLATEYTGVWPDRRVVLVLTQDCDLVHPSYEVEPSVELIAGGLVDAADNGLRHGRNPRRLHVDVEHEKGTSVLAISIHNRLVVRRAELEDYAPHESTHLGPEQRRLVCEWVAKRYVRAAFPDAFNSRVQAAHKKIEKALKRGGEHVTGLFLMIDPDEEREEGQDYRLVLRVTARTELLADEKTEVALVNLAQGIANALAACNGVVVENHELVSETQFTLEDLRFFKRWDWDYRSHSGEPGGDVAPTP